MRFTDLMNNGKENVSVDEINEGASSDDKKLVKKIQTLLDKLEVSYDEFDDEDARAKVIKAHDSLVSTLQKIR